MQDGPVRRAIKAVARAGYAADLAVARWWLRRRGLLPYELGGECRACAECCDEPAMELPALAFRVRPLRALMVLWQRVVNGFVLLREEGDAHVLVFRCTHFDVATRRCDSYESRPGMCRDYPRLLLHQATPRFLPGCGHRAVRRDAAGMLRLLEDASVTAEQRERLRKGLFLE
ncbi:MAG: YkgJ family cysteine cluster protein [Deltaproteobacteria bacterium]|nr:YkgJ family cysteine cluster protein [Deltaproteobacteria bacterium]